MFHWHFEHMYVLVISGLMDGRMGVYASSMRSPLPTHPPLRSSPDFINFTKVSFRKIALFNVDWGWAAHGRRREANAWRMQKIWINIEGAPCPTTAIKLPSPDPHARRECKTKRTVRKVNIVRSSRQFNFVFNFVFHFVDQSSTGIQLNLVAAIRSGRHRFDEGLLCSGSLADKNRCVSFTVHHSIF